MTNAKHTPGPWKSEITFERIDSYRGIPIFKNGNMIAKAVLFDSVSVPRSESIANARLIAACPIMFAFVKTEAGKGNKEAIDLLNTIN